MKKTLLFFLILGCIPVFSPVSVFADEVGAIQQSERRADKEIQLRQQIQKEKPEAPIEEEAAKPAPLSESKEKVMVTNISVAGVTLLPQQEIEAIVAQFRGKELTINEMQKAADLITDAYRKKGYVTSRAYLPPQKIEGGKLEIKVLEGMTGDIAIKGNRYFKTALLRKKIALQKGQPFNYDILRKGLTLINEQPDRNARAVITAGKDPGTTDVVLEVKDRLPIHMGLAWDDFGSRYINYNRFKTVVTDNNLIGWDDSLEIQYQGSEGENYLLLSGRYQLPLTDSLKVGMFAARSRIRLQKEYEDLDARGKSKLFSAYATQSLINGENVDLNLNVGFDYKDIFNFQSGSETSRDRLRVLRAGFDLDITDNFGRTLLSEEFDYGIPGIMAGLKKHDSRASRAGSGGQFTKNTVNFLRLQKMPFNSNLLWKNQWQFSPYILTSTEEFQIGGISNVRGYPAAEVVGDNGTSMTWEYSIPLYFMPKSVKFPLSKARFYDAVRIVTFYDWATTRLKRPGAGEQKDRTLRSAGCGLRINLPEDFSARVEFAWPLDNRPSDGKGVQAWTEVSKTF